MSAAIHINIGCGPQGQLPGFVNLDNSPSIWLSKVPLAKRMLHRLGKLTDQQMKDDWTGVVKCDASRRIPFADQTVTKIYSSHFLEHIPYSRGLHVLRECYRVLHPQGTMRLVVPDLLWHAQRYVEQTQAILEKSATSTDRIAHDQFLETVYGAYLQKKRFGLHHCYMYDLPTLTNILQSVGFQNVRRCEYQQGGDAELAAFDSRPGDSLHLEIRKA